MQTNVSPMACGNCGRGLFKMYSAPTNYGFKLIAECNNCKSTSIIEPTMPKLDIDWGENAGGILCNMTPKDS